MQQNEAKEYIKQAILQFRLCYLVKKTWLSFNNYGFRWTVKKVFNFLLGRRRLRWLFMRPLFSQHELERQRNYSFPQERTFSIIVPLYNTPPKFLEEMIQSVRDQTYDKWELCMADGSDEEHRNVEEICREFSDKDSRIRYKKLEKNLGISGNTNACLEMATGDYIGLFDHDDLLHPAALFEVMRTISQTEADFIYTDELTFSKKIRNVTSVHYKPDFAPDNLRANNYICHFTVFSRKVLQEAGPFREEYDGSQDHDFILRATEKARKIVHIPEVLYYWRSHPSSVAWDINSKIYAVDAGKRAVSDHINRMGMSATVESSEAFPAIYHIRYDLAANPLVSIIILLKKNFEEVSVCVESILANTTYPNFEIIIIDSSSSEQRVRDCYKDLWKRIRTVRISILDWPTPCNDSAMNNWGVQHAAGEQLILLGSDTKVISPGWIEEMLMYAQRPDVGAVGAKLYNADDTIEHAGIILGLGAERVAGYAFHKVEKKNIGYMGRLCYAQNYSAVTADCMMVPKYLWEEVGGLDEKFLLGLNDVDLCMRIRKVGYLIVWTPYAELYHYKSEGQWTENIPEKCNKYREEAELFRERWKKELAAGDPYYNPNLTLDRENFSF